MRRIFLRWLADRLILRPTRHPLDATDKTRRWVPFGDGGLEVWRQRAPAESSTAADLYVLKFPGTAGRAERSTVHPADAWPDSSVELWTLNPPGYGGSSGKPSLQIMAAMADTVFACLRQNAAGRPILVLGNSLGCVSALYLAARHPLAGLILRNPPALREVIVARYGWRTWKFGIQQLVQQIPPDLDAIRNAAAATAPAVIVSSQRDRVVPLCCQQQIIDAYAGPNRVLRLMQADHHTPMMDDETPSYQDALNWLRRQIVGRPAAP